MLLFLHWRPRYFVCTLSSLRTYSCIIACLTFSALFRMGADLNTTSIWQKMSREKKKESKQRVISCLFIRDSCVTANVTWRPLTIVLECFHLVSLLRILSRLIQENRFLQQNWLLSPASCNKEIVHSKHPNPTVTCQQQQNNRNKGGKITKLSAVNSGSSCTTQYGKSSTEMLWGRKK